MKLKELEDYLNNYLEINKFNDYSPNGIQVESNNEVKKIALGVSASLSLFESAKKISADTLIVHHGLFWKNQNMALKGVIAKRIKYLFNNEMNLIGYHLPLDAHPLSGNNARIADKLLLSEKEAFAKHGGHEIGVIGSLKKEIPLNSIEKQLKDFFGQINYVYPFGKKKIKKVAIVSGGAASDVSEAYEKGADLFITGEANEPTEHWCKEAKINYIALGHYISEKLGVKALGKLIEKEFKIECTFIDILNKV